MFRWTGLSFSKIPKNEPNKIKQMTELRDWHSLGGRGREEKLIFKKVQTPVAMKTNSEDWKESSGWGGGQFVVRIQEILRGK